LIMCLKGLQLAYNPADYLTAEQLKKSAKLRREYEELKKASLDPYVALREAYIQYRAHLIEK